MSYRVELAQNTADALERLDENIIQRIVLRLNWMAINYEKIKPHPLTGDLKGYFKLRIGHYRAIYSVNRQQQIILVEHIGHRRDIYKKP